MDPGKNVSSSHNNVLWIALSGLLILRLPFLTGAQMISRGEIIWVEPVYQIGTYALTAFLICWERNRLASFHIDPLVIAIIMFFKPLETLILSIWGMNTPLTFPHPLSFSFLIIAIVMFIFLWRGRFSLGQSKKASLFWILMGSICGLTLVLILSIIQIGFLHFPIPPAVGMLALTSPIYQLGYAAVDEEPLFRGFLWGALKSLRLKDPWIILIQALLFSTGHLFLLQTPFALIYLVINFGFALCAGLLVWRSRTIVSSMGFHAFWNGSAYFIHGVSSIIFKG
jgi:membrane protease YdiL (CAAX protease family)